MSEKYSQSMGSHYCSDLLKLGLYKALENRVLWVRSAEESKHAAPFTACLLRSGGAATRGQNCCRDGLSTENTPEKPPFVVLPLNTLLNISLV